MFSILVLYLTTAPYGHGSEIEASYQRSTLLPNRDRKGVGWSSFLNPTSSDLYPGPRRVLLHLRLGLIFRRAFRLNLTGLEDSVGTQFSVSKGLCPILERVRQRIDPVVNHLQHTGVLMQSKRYFGAIAYDGTLSNIAAHAEPLALGLIAHLPKLGDGLVVSLAFADAAHRQPNQHTDNYNDQGRELHVSLHGFAPETPV